MVSASYSGQNCNLASPFDLPTNKSDAVRKQVDGPEWSRAMERLHYGQNFEKNLLPQH